MAIDAITNKNLQAVPETLATPVDGAGAAEIAEEIAPLISGQDNLQVISTRRTDGTEKKTETKDVPELDDADTVLALEADLEALIALLTAEQDEKQVEASKTRIEALKGQMQAHHEQTMKKVQESLDAMKKQESASLASKILGWISAAVAVVVAIAMVATVGGAAAGLAVLGAVIGLTTQTLTETGAMDKLTKALAESIQGTFGCSSDTAKTWAQAIIGAVGIILSAACLIGGSFAQAGTGLVKQVTEGVMRAVKIGSTIASGVTSTASLATTGASTALTYEASEQSAEITKLQKFLTQLQTALDQEEDDLKLLLEQLSNSLDSVLELLESKFDTLNTINQHIGA